MTVARKTARPSAMNYAVHYAGIGKDEESGKSRKVTTVVAWGEGFGPNQTTLPKEPQEQRKEFVELLTARSTVYIPTGGGADYFTLACHNQGARVMRLPTCRLADINRQSRNGDAVPEVGSVEAVARGGISVNLVYCLALQRPEWFMPYEAMDVTSAKLRHLGRMYKMVQNDIRKPMMQRLETPVRGMEILGDFGTDIADFSILSQEETAAYIFADLHSVGFGLAKDFAALLDKVEKRILTEIGGVLKKLPLWTGYINNIPGIGPSIGSRLIGEIGDIELFPSDSNLIAYAGYHVQKDGRAARRTSGEVANWSPELRQAVYDFTVQTFTKGGTGNPWKRAFNHRREYEELKQKRFDAMPPGERSYPPQRAMRWLGQKLLRHLWHTWHRYLDGVPYRYYDFGYLHDEAAQLPAHDSGDAEVIA